MLTSVSYWIKQYFYIWNPTSTFPPSSIIFDVVQKLQNMYSVSHILENRQLCMSAHLFDNTYTLSQKSYTHPAYTYVSIIICKRLILLLLTLCCPDISIEGYLHCKKWHVKIITFHIILLYQWWGNQNIFHLLWVVYILHKKLYTEDVKYHFTCYRRWGGI